MSAIALDCPHASPAVIYLPAELKAFRRGPRRAFWQNITVPNGSYDRLRAYRYPRLDTWTPDLFATVAARLSQEVTATHEAMRVYTSVLPQENRRPFVTMYVGDDSRRIELALFDVEHFCRREERRLSDPMIEYCRSLADGVPLETLRARQVGA